VLDGQQLFQCIHVLATRHVGSMFDKYRHTTAVAIPAAIAGTGCSYRWRAGSPSASNSSLACSCASLANTCKVDVWARVWFRPFCHAGLGRVSIYRER